MRFPWRRASGQAADGPPGWFGPPRLAERSCCCPARPVVMVLIPPVSARRHAVDLLLCGHHYQSSKAALAAVGAVAVDETGTIVDPASPGDIRTTRPPSPCAGRPVPRRVRSRSLTPSPVTARPMSIRWISDMPSKIVKILETGGSFRR